jgi:hypothetical protein
MSLDDEYKQKERSSHILFLLFVKCPSSRQQNKRKCAKYVVSIHSYQQGKYRHFLGKNAGMKFIFCKVTVFQ